MRNVRKIPTPVMAVVQLLVFFLAGCAAQSQFIPAPPSGTPNGSTAYPQPGKKALVIYNHGSTEEYRWDQCRPNGSTTPSVIKELSGKTVQGLEIVVYGFCTPAKIGRYRQESRTGEPKVMRRAEDIEKVVRTFQDSGVPPEQTFLAGNSAGAWASLLVARRHKVSLNAVIAFAPAFAGRKVSRQPGWQALHDDHVRFMSEAREMHALVYVFDSDPFNSPQDLAFLGRIPGVRLVRLSARDIDGNQWNSFHAHGTAFMDFFARTQEEVILAYLGERLRAMGRD